MQRILAIRPGGPFWAAFTAFCANEVALFALDKTDVLNVERAWLATVSGLFVAGAVYGRAKLDEIKNQNAQLE